MCRHQYSKWLIGCELWGGEGINSVYLFTEHSGFLRQKAVISSGLVVLRIFLRLGPSVGSFESTPGQ